MRGAHGGEDADAKAAPARRRRGGLARNAGDSSWIHGGARRARFRAR